MVKSQKIEVVKLEKMEVVKSGKSLTQNFPVLALHAQPLPPKSAPGVGRSTTVPGKHCRKDRV